VSSLFCDKNEDEGYSSGRIGIVSIIIYVKRISRCIEEEYYEKLRKWESKLCNSRGVCNRLKKEFGGGRNNVTMKVVELKKVKQRNKTMEEFI